MPNLHLTDLTVRSLKPGTYFDDHTPSFGIRVGVNRKTWIVLKQPNRTKIRIGHYPDLPLAEARKRALVVIGSPLQIRKAPQFADALEEFFEKHGAHLKPQSLYQLTRTIRRHFSWSKPLDKITHHDIVVAIEAIEAKSEAAHALKDLKTFFSWCVPRYISTSPCTGIKAPHRYVPRSRVLDEREIVKVWRASAVIGSSFAPFCQLLVTSGQRRNQIASLRWSWIDQEARVFKFPADVMKGNRPHVLPYGDLTASILADVPIFNDLLFPARGTDKPTVSQGKIKIKLDELSGVPEHTFHDLRRSFAVGLQKLGVSVEIIETLLAHRSGVFGGIVGIYQRHDFMDEMRAAVDKWENKLGRLLEG